MLPVQDEQDIILPNRHISSRNLILLQDENYDLDLTMLDSNEHDPSAQFTISNFIYRKEFDNTSRTLVGPKQHIIFDQSDPNVHQLNLNVAPI